MRTLRALRTFLEHCKKGLGPSSLESYDYRELEEVLTPTVTWLMINLLCQKDVLSYGTSPRFGFLTIKGERLKEFILERTVEDLYELAAGGDEFYVECDPDACNCGPNGYEQGRICQNPFWLESALFPLRAETSFQRETPEA